MYYFYVSIDRIKGTVQTITMKFTCFDIHSKTCGVSSGVADAFLEALASSAKQVFIRSTATFSNFSDNNLLLRPLFMAYNGDYKHGCADVE